VKLVSVHVMVPYAVKARLSREARKAGMPFSMYIRRVLYNATFQIIANEQTTERLGYGNEKTK